MLLPGAPPRRAGGLDQGSCDPPIVLRTRYTMSGPVIAYVFSAACYAMCGTEIGYVATDALRDVRY
eukprot:3109657-Rhodomonas_salina.5